MSIKEIKKKLKAFAEEDEILELVDWLNNYINNEDICKRMNKFLESYATQISAIPCKECKDIKYLDGKKLENALINARFYGWEKGKEQVKTPHDFTLADDTYIENIWKELMELAIPECKKCKKLEDMKFSLTVRLNSMSNLLKAELIQKCNIEKERDSLLREISKLKTEVKNHRKLWQELGSLVIGMPGEYVSKSVVKGIKELKAEVERLKKNIQDWKDGDYISINALKVFIEDYNAGCDKGQEIDPDSADYFCEGLDPIKDE